jgi:hypothetical protein
MSTGGKQDTVSGEAGADAMNKAPSNQDRLRRACWYEKCVSTVQIHNISLECNLGLRQVVKDISNRKCELKYWWTEDVECLIAPPDA